MDKNKKKSIITVIIIVTLLILLSVAFYIIYNTINSATLIVRVAPASASIYLDNHRVSNGNIKVTPGEHTLRAQKEGFEEKSIQVSAIADQESNALIILESNSESTANWYTDHSEDQKLIEEIYSLDFTAASNQITSEYPLINYLPYSIPDYDINYGTCNDNNFCIMINAFLPSGYNEAIKYLRQRDSDLGKYYFSFTDFDNPFSKLPVSNAQTSAQTITQSDLNSATNYINKILTNYQHNIISTKIFDDKYIITLFSYSIDNEFPQPINYRLVLQKYNNSFELIVTPDQILTYNQYPDIPKEVLSAANNLN
ncbi:PEGA domain-containing protein [Candidatus Saccharibacteria bacterium]|nr:PEGA domain-containing protein [Candidatus Saccharibacteria bacterium]